MRLSSPFALLGDSESMRGVPSLDRTEPRVEGGDGITFAEVFGRGGVENTPPGMSRGAAMFQASRTASLPLLYTSCRSDEAVPIVPLYTSNATLNVARLQSSSA